METQQIATPKPLSGNRRLGHPATVTAASLAALDAGRVHWAQQRKCQSPGCKQPAMRDRPRCIRHDTGRGGLGAREVSPARDQLRTLDRMARLGLLPGELVAMPLWQDLGRRGMAVRAPAQMGLTLAWSGRKADPSAWAKVWRMAQHAVRDHAPVR